MRKVSFMILTFVAVAFYSMLFTNPSNAEGKDLQEVKEERSEIKEGLTKSEEEVADLLIDIKLVNDEIADIDKALKENEKVLEEARVEVEEVEMEIVLLDKKIADRFDILKARAQSYQKNGGNMGYLDVVFGSKDFSEFISRVAAITTIADSDAALIKEQEEDKAKVEEKLTVVKELENELKVIEENILEQKQGQMDIKDELEEKQTELKELTSDLKMKDEKLAKMEAKIITEMGLSFSNGEAVAGGGGILGWPTQGGYISSPMGTRNGRLHKGIDIARTNRSTSPPIFAADSGTVESASYGNGYGNKVVINHNNGMKTLYAHMSSMNVSAGQVVSKGDQLGIMGNTGNSRGIHLHFEVFINGALQNPKSFLQ